jgi:hypothetical protein
MGCKSSKQSSQKHSKIHDYNQSIDTVGTIDTNDNQNKKRGILKNKSSYLNLVKGSTRTLGVQQSSRNIVLNSDFDNNTESEYKSYIYSPIDSTKDNNKFVLTDKSIDITTGRTDISINDLMEETVVHESSISTNITLQNTMNNKMISDLKNIIKSQKDSSDTIKIHENINSETTINMSNEKLDNDNNDVNLDLELNNCPTDNTNLSPKIM